MDKTTEDKMAALSADICKKMADMVERELFNELTECEKNGTENLSALQASIYFNLASWYMATTLHVSERVSDGGMGDDLRKEMIASVIQNATIMEGLLSSKKTEELVDELQ